MDRVIIKSDYKSALKTVLFEFRKKYSLGRIELAGNIGISVGVVSSLELQGLASVDTSDWEKICNFFKQYQINIDDTFIENNPKRALKRRIDAGVEGARRGRKKTEILSQVYNIPEKSFYKETKKKIIPLEPEEVINKLDSVLINIPESTKHEITITTNPKSAEVIDYKMIATLKIIDIQEKLKDLEMERSHLEYLIKFLKQ